MVGERWLSRIHLLAPDCFQEALWRKSWWFSLDCMSQLDRSSHHKSVYSGLHCHHCRSFGRMLWASWLGAGDQSWLFARWHGCHCGARRQVTGRNCSTRPSPMRYFRLFLWKWGSLLWRLWAATGITRPWATQSSSHSGLLDLCHPRQVVFWEESKGHLALARPLLVWVRQGWAPKGLLE